MAKKNKDDNIIDRTLNGKNPNKQWDGPGSPENPNSVTATSKKSKKK